jgi:hypothetical protein
MNCGWVIALTNIGHRYPGSQPISFSFFREKSCPSTDKEVSLFLEMGYEFGDGYNEKQKGWFRRK